MKFIKYWFGNIPSNKIDRDIQRIEGIVRQSEGINDALDKCRGLDLLITVYHIRRKWNLSAEEISIFLNKKHLDLNCN